MWKVFYVSIVVSLVVLGLLLFADRAAEAKQEPPALTDAVEQMASEKTLPALPEIGGVKTPEALYELARACPAEIGFYGKNFTMGEELAYRADQPACLASIAKLFVLGELARQMEAGGIGAEESVTIVYEDRQDTCSIDEAVDRMIGVSDNEATVALAKRVGYDRVNAVAGELGIKGLSKTILPEWDRVSEVLDMRVFERRMVEAGEDLPPWHGTARGIVGYLERLHEQKLFSEAVSRRVLEGLERNPKPFAPKGTPAGYKSVGKGGSLLWIRPPRPHYNMLGWGLYIYNEEEAVAFCLWSEWFPQDIAEARRNEWLMEFSGHIVNLLLKPEHRILSN